MSTRKEHEKEDLPVSGGLVDGPLDYDRLKSEIRTKGPISQFHPKTELTISLDITPCLCGFEPCNEDVISVSVQHGATSFRSTVDKKDLTSQTSVSAFFHDFFHHPEVYYRSTADEQMIELEIYRKLSVEPFAVYSAKDSLASISEQLSNSEINDTESWQAHNLLSLLRILNVKRRLRKGAKEDKKPVSSDQLDCLILDTFDIGFLAGRLWSEYRTKENLEELVEKGEASVIAQEKRTKASASKSSEKRFINIEYLLKEIENLAGHHPAFSEESIFKQAYENARVKNPNMPKSKKTLDEYGTVLRSEEPFKSRYEAVFRKNA